MPLCTPAGSLHAQTVRLYTLAAADASAEEAPQQAQLVHTFEHEAAVLDVVWIDEQRAASASLDRCVRLCVGRAALWGAGLTAQYHVAGSTSRPASRRSSAGTAAA